MEIQDLLSNLKTYLSEESAKDVLRALRLDQLVWQTITEPVILEKVIETAKNQPDFWSPASIALISLDCNLSLNVLKSLPLHPIDQSISLISAREFEKFIQSAEFPHSIKQAGQIALTLRERRRITGTWLGLLSELIPNDLGQSANTNAFSRWQTPLTVLYGFAPDPLDFLSALIPNQSTVVDEELITLILHILLSNPSPTQEIVEIILNLLQISSPEQHHIWLRGLSETGIDDLAVMVAEKLDTNFNINHDSLETITSTGLSKNAGYELINNIVNASQRADYKVYSKDSDSAIESLSNAYEDTCKLQIEINKRIAELVEQKHDYEAAILSWKQVLEFAPDMIEAKQGIVRAMIRCGREEEAENEFPDIYQHPELLIPRAIAAYKAGKCDLAKTLVMQAFQENYGLNNSELLQLVMDLGYTNEALIIANQMIEKQPTNPKILSNLCHILKASGNLSEAEINARLAVFFDPNNVDLHRLAAKIFEEEEKWQAAFDEWQSCVAFKDQVTFDDYMALAKAGLKNNETDIAEKSCFEALRLNQDDVMAHILLGEILSAKKKLDEAAEHFKKATILDPNRADTWLALARTHEALGKQQTAYETLVSAANAIPEAFEIQFALGKAYQQTGEKEKALSAFERAYQKKPDNIDVIKAYSQSLFDAGQFVKTSQLLAAVRRDYPTDVDISFLLGKALFNSGNKQEALPQLLAVLHSTPDNLEANLLHARALLDIDNEQSYFVDPNNTSDDETRSLDYLNDAINSLLRALELEPDCFDANLLLADALLRTGNYSKALEIFTGLSKRTPEMDLQTKKKIDLGIGKASLKLGLIDTALASLQEAAQHDPDDVETQILLSEAFFSANLVGDAFKAAKNVLRLSPNNPNVLSWYAQKAMASGEYSQASSVLERVVQLRPDHIPSRILLGKAKQKAGDNAGAWNSFHSVLSNEMAVADNLIDAARSLMTMRDFQTAVSCLKKGILKSDNPSISLYLELICTCIKAGKFKEAIDSIDKTLAVYPGNAHLLVVQADINVLLHRFQEAMICLKSAVNYVNQTDQTNSAENNENRTNNLIFGINYRLALLERAEGNLRSASEHAKTALKVLPFNEIGMSFYADLHYSMLDYNESLFDSQISEILSSKNNLSQSILDLICLSAEIALENDEWEKAAHLMDNLDNSSIKNPRVYLIKSRLTNNEGNFQKASELFEEALACQKERQNHSYAYSDITIDQLMSWAERQPDEYIYPNSSVTLFIAFALAALELKKWDNAISFSDLAIQNGPSEPRSYLTQTKVIVCRMEYKAFCEALDVQSHLPALADQNDDYSDLFEKAIGKAGSLSGSVEVNRWLKRGKVAFHPAEDTIKSLMSIMHTWHDASAILIGLKKINLVKQGYQIAQSYLDKPDILAKLALILSNENPTDAFKFASKAIELSPRQPLYLVLFAKLAVKVKDFIRACQAIDMANSIWDNEVQWHILAADIYSQCDDQFQVILHLEKANDLVPNDYNVLLKLGEVYLAANEYHRAINTLTDASQLMPAQSKPLMMLAKAYQLIDNLPQAITCIERAVTNAPNELEPLIMAAELMMICGNDQQAKKYIDSALRIKPYESKILASYAKVMKKMGRAAEALNKIDQIIAEVPDPLPVLIERVNLLRHLNNKQQIQASIQELLLSYPDEPAVLALAAESFFETGKVEEALSAAQKSLHLQPGQRELHLLAGSILHNLGQLDQAIYHLSEAIRISSREIEPFLELGQIYQSQRDYMKSLEMYKRAIELSDHDPRPYYQAGLVLKEIKDYAGAEKMFKHAVDISPNDLNSRKQLGAIMALNLVHNPQEAIL
jgi:tetratricopeptide (TPR) repeat protein